MFAYDRAAIRGVDVLFAADGSKTIFCLSGTLCTWRGQIVIFII